MGIVTIRSKTTRILFVCSGSKDRSPTAEALFKYRTGIETRSAGINDDAVHKVNKRLLDWPDIIIVMVRAQERFLRSNFIISKRILSLGIPDRYDYMDPKLVNKIKAKCSKLRVVYRD